MCGGGGCLDGGMRLESGKTCLIFTDDVIDASHGGAEVGGATNACTDWDCEVNFCTACVDGCLRIFFNRNISGSSPSTESWSYSGLVVIMLNVIELGICNGRSIKC